jgi:two-component system cell cycle sensor histidine kinase/response regulator CckA
MRAPTRKARPAGRAPRTVSAAGTEVPPALDPIITMNAAGIIQSASDSVEQVFGWKPAELFGRNMSVFIPEPKRSDLDRYLDRYRRASRKDARGRTGRFDAVHKDGSIFPIELSMSRADLPAHSAPFFVGIIRDISREIDVSAGPDEERTRLQKLITEQTRALATANLRLQLSDRLASLGTLAAGLGHDINNVLLPVRARLNALESAPIPRPARAHVAALRSSIEYLQQLSDGLHHLSIDPADPDVAPGGDGFTSLGEWWEQVGVLLRKAVPRHVALQASVPAGLPVVAIGSHWLTQAVLNLLVNAGEAIPVRRRGVKGRVRIAAETAPDGSVRLSVTDNGRGMSPEVQRRAFDLFYTTKTRGMGTGLGLPLVRKVVVRAGGSVELASQPGKGSTVTLVLPAGGSVAGWKGGTASEAAVSIRSARTAALVVQVLRGAGLITAARPGGQPGKADFWVTEPTSRALRAVRAWRHRRPRRMVILVGTPSRQAKAGWAAVGATIIEDPAEFAAVRDGVAQAMGRAARAR